MTTVSEDVIRQLTESIWESILHRPVVAAEAPLTGGSRTMVGCIHITGAWRGTVAFSCSAGQAAEAAAIMFGLEPAAVTLPDMQDAVGELVNMLGGNIKSLLPQPSQLSLPAVVEGTDFSVRIPASRTIASVPFFSGEHALNVSVLESDGTQPHQFVTRSSSAVA